jgi:hypothetical protein
VSSEAARDVTPLFFPLFFSMNHGQFPSRQARRRGQGSQEVTKFKVVSFQFKVPEPALTDY